MGPRPQVSSTVEATEAEICNGSAGGDGKKGGRGKGEVGGENEGQKKEGQNSTPGLEWFVRCLRGAARFGDADGFVLRHNRWFSAHLSHSANILPPPQPPSPLTA